MADLERAVRSHLQSIPHGEVARRAELAGLARETVSGWRTGNDRFNPTLESLVNLAQALRLSLPELLGVESEPADSSLLAAVRDLAESHRRLLERLEHRELDYRWQPPGESLVNEPASRYGREEERRKEE